MNPLLEGVNLSPNSTADPSPESAVAGVFSPNTLYDPATVSGTTVAVDG